ncbi:hypothetical protein Ssi02_33230 [Sinosporangium siamense]|uniref:Uncharacterized protein n=1 Tax=Sinosporangium siamense TaxID=1367973 RepID=A0A919V8D2_9ACTN|nr:hypothetical protein Ssi02_33230 [Sinosporangium siamense]
MFRTSNTVGTATYSPAFTGVPQVRAAEGALDLYRTLVERVRQEACARGWRPPVRNPATALNTLTDPPSGCSGTQENTGRQEGAEPPHHDISARHPHQASDNFDFLDN